MPEPGILAFACDHITKLCTCGVPQRRDTFCTANEDCELADASCRSLSAGLELSGTDIPCSSCSSRSVCFRATAGAAGLCACSAGLRDNLHRCAPRAKYEFLLLHFDRLCLWHSAPAGPAADVVEFRAASVIPCKNLDPIAAACTYAIDINLYVVRGGSGFDARRRLLAEPVEDSAEDTVWSRDALSADNIDITADNTFITADGSPQRVPILLNPQGSIGTVRNDNFFA
jgi:hypothetical protein